MANQARVEGLDEALAGLKDLQQKIPSIAARTISETAKDAARNLQGWLPRLLDRPTPWTVERTQVKIATKTDLTAGVGINYQGRKNEQNKSLTDFVTKPAPVAMRKQVYGGGGRKHKQSERTLMRNNILPSGWYIVPASGAKKHFDKYGNVTGSFMNKVLYTGVEGGSTGTPLSGFEQRAKGEKRVKGKRGYSPYFVKYLQPSARRGPIGIYRRINKNSIEAVFFFVRTVSYKVRVQHDNMIAQYVQRHWQRHFRESVDKARLKLKTG